MRRVIRNPDSLSLIRFSNSDDTHTDRQTFKFRPIVCLFGGFNHIVLQTAHRIYKSIR